MTEKELLQAIEGMLAPIQNDITQLRSLSDKVDAMDKKLESLAREVSGTKVLLDAEVYRDIKLLAEGQSLILERLPSPEEQEALETRVSAVEAVVKLHSKQIAELKKAQ